jgi:hypothetical protein
MRLSESIDVARGKKKKTQRVWRKVWRKVQYKQTQLTFPEISACENGSQVS